MKCFLALPTQDLTQYRESTQGSCVTKSSWVLMGELCLLLSLDLPPCGSRKTYLFWVQPDGVCTEGFSQAVVDPSFTWQDSGIPTSKVYSNLTSQIPSGMVCSCMCKHLLHLCLLTGQPDSVTRLYQLGILSGLGLLHDIHQPTLAGLQPRETWAPGRPTVFTGC